MKIFSVFDSAVEAFMQPMFVRAKGEAVRLFTDACNDNKTPLQAHPEHYSLWYIGEFEDSSGTLVPCKVPERVILGIECVENWTPPAKGVVPAEFLERYGNRPRQ